MVLEWTENSFLVWPRTRNNHKRKSGKAGKKRAVHLQDGRRLF